MKTKITFFLPFFLLYNFLYAQPQVSKITYQGKNLDGIWTTVALETFEYNSANLKVLRLYDYYGYPGPPHHYFEVNRFEGNRWEYDEHGRMTKVVNLSRDSTGHIFGTSNETYEYDVNGCLLSETYRSYSPSSNNNVGSRKEFTYIADCQLDTAKYFYVLNSNGTEYFQPDYNLVYKYEDSGKRALIDYFGWGHPDSAWFFIENYRTKIYDDDGRLLVNIDSFTDIGPEMQRYSYYSNGDKKTLESFFARHIEWELIGKDSFIYDYDQAGLLSEKTIYYLNLQADTFQQYSTRYDYYCDGLLRTAYEGGRAVYEYTEGAECYEPSEKSGFIISPNPANSILTLRSEDFQSGAISVAIYDVLGKSLSYTDIDYRTENVELDISHLPNGTYFVHIFNGGENRTEKLIVSR